MVTVMVKGNEVRRRQWRRGEEVVCDSAKLDGSCIRFAQIWCGILEAVRVALSWRTIMGWSTTVHQWQQNNNSYLGPLNF